MMVVLASSCSSTHHASLSSRCVESVETRDIVGKNIAAREVIREGHENLSAESLLIVLDGTAQRQWQEGLVSKDFLASCPVLHHLLGCFLLLFCFQKGGDRPLLECKDNTEP